MKQGETDEAVGAGQERDALRAACELAEVALASLTPGRDPTPTETALKDAIQRFYDCLPATAATEVRVIKRLRELGVSSEGMPDQSILWAADKLEVEFLGNEKK